MQSNAVILISKSPSLVAMCNRVLGKQFRIFWLNSSNKLQYNLNPVVVLSDEQPVDFAKTYSFFQQPHVKCFNISTIFSFPEKQRDNFPKAKFIDPQNELLLKLSVESAYQFSSNSSSPIDEYCRRLYCAAESDETVLFLGSIGAGKTHDAEFLHQLSPRKTKAFVRFTIAEQNPSSIESELFGVAKNTFTGVEEKMGALKLAQGGTIFFDEITEIPLYMQAKILTLISERKFHQIGGDREEVFTGRFIFATNADIETLVEQGKFRADLYSRINVLRLKVPDLNEHSQDIVKFALQYASENKKTLTTNAVKKLKAFNWTGNIRQLRNVVVRACVFAPTKVVHQRDIEFD